MNRSSLEMSLETSKNPIGLPFASRRGVITDAAAVFSDAANHAFPFAVAQGGVHDRAGLAGRDVFRGVEDV